MASLGPARARPADAPLASAEKPAPPTDSSFTIISGYRVKKGDMSCDGFPQIAVKTLPGMCAGLVLGEQSGFKMPRYLVQLRTGDFLLSDMGGWALGKGTVYLIRLGNRGVRSVVDLFPKKLDMPNGLALDPEGRPYVGTPFEVFRFSPYKEGGTEPDINPSRDVIINDLPHPRDMVAKMKHKHPLTVFAFDNEGDLYVNTGAPSDHCEVDKVEPKGDQLCAHVDGPNP